MFRRHIISSACAALYPRAAKTVLCLLGAAVFLTPGPARAETPSAQTNGRAQIIRLKDGNILKGQLVAVDGKIYTIRTSSLGEIRVHMEDIESISRAGHAGQPPASASGHAAAPPLPLNMLQEKMLNDPEVRACVDDIMADEQIMSLLENQDLIGTILQGNPQALMENEKIMVLMQNPKMMKLMSLLMAKMQAGGTGH